MATQWFDNTRMMMEEFHVLKYAACDTNYDQVVKLSERLRSADPELKYIFHRIRLDVPEDLRQMCAVESELHNAFKKAVDALTITYDAKDGQIIILSAKERTIQKVNMFSDIHFRNLQTKLSEMQKIEEARQQLEIQRQRAPIFNEEFTIEEDFMDLAIGTHGENIKTAREIPGVTKIEVNEETCSFNIFGEDEEAVKRARTCLELKEHVIYVPTNLTGKIIGKKANLLKKLEIESGVSRIYIDDEEEGMVPFVFIGTKESITSASNLMDTRLNQLKIAADEAKMKKTLPTTAPKKKNVEAHRDLEIPGQLAPSLYDHFSVREDLMGLAIGPRGAKVNLARGIPGVTGIEIEEETCTFHVYGKDKEAFIKVRKQLEFTEDVVQIPQNFVGKVVGKRGALINDIQKKSGATRIRIDPEDYYMSRKQGFVPFVIVGTKESVTNAAALLQNQLKIAKEAAMRWSNKGTYSYSYR